MLIYGPVPTLSKARLMLERLSPTDSRPPSRRGGFLFVRRADPKLDFFVLRRLRGIFVFLQIPVQQLALFGLFAFLFFSRFEFLQSFDGNDFGGLHRYRIGRFEREFGQRLISRTVKPDGIACAAGIEFQRRLLRGDHRHRLVAKWTVTLALLPA